MDELLARPRAVARRGQTAPDDPVVVTGDLTVDLAAHKVLRAGEEVRLTPTEWALPDILVRNRGRLVSQRQLLREVWGRQYERETHSLRVYLGHLRRKLEAEPARTGSESASPRRTLVTRCKGCRRLSPCAAPATPERAAERCLP